MNKHKMQDYAKKQKKLDHMQVHLMHGAPVTHEWLVAAIGSEGTLF